MKHRIRRQRAPGVDAVLAQDVDGGCYDVDVFAAERAVLAGMRIEARYRKPRVSQSEMRAEIRDRDPGRRHDQLGRQSGGHVLQRKMDRHRHDRERLGPDHHHRTHRGADLPPLRDVIREHSLSARKSLGQNFLLDLNLTARIARAAGPLEGATVIEVGPGPGGLTRALLALGAKRVIAVERDERALAPLDYIARRYPGRLDIVHADAQRFDPRPMLGGEPARIVANLPYNIATALLVDWLSIEPWPPWYDMMVLMFQREVAERIVARENDEAYGRLAVLANWRAETKILFDISPAAFVPQPKVTSSVVRLVPRVTPEPCDRRALEQVAAAAFGQRRKMLRQSLKSLSVDPARLAGAAAVDATRRAETIPVSGFVAMARELTDIRNTKPQTP